jgi:hypothetical protein
MGLLDFDCGVLLGRPQVKHDRQVGFVRDLDERAGIRRLVECGRNHQRDRLTRIMNPVVLKW